jgi:hypothetical protein
MDQTGSIVTMDDNFLSSPPPHSNKTRKNPMTNDNAWREINFTETEQTLQEAEEGQLWGQLVMF